MLQSGRIAGVGSKKLFERSDTVSGPRQMYNTDPFHSVEDTNNEGIDNEDSGPNKGWNYCPLQYFSGL